MGAFLVPLLVFWVAVIAAFFEVTDQLPLV